MQRPPLSNPISVFMRPTFVLQKGSSLIATASKLRENSAALVPVCDGPVLLGVVTERSLSAALARGVDVENDVALAFDAHNLSILLTESAAEALRRIEEFGIGALVVIDADRRVAGVVRASDLIDPPSLTATPAMIGGMATPFGVYLTSGVVKAGVSEFALMTTGMLMFSVLTGASILTDSFAHLLTTRHVPDWGIQLVASNLLLVVFGLTFRLLPISGIHAAEHMVVHAIERGEPLIPSIVRRMPRIHPRCGTNLAVGSTFFLGIATNPLIQPDELRLLLALVLTVMLWRPLGALVQYWVTTKPPTDKQLMMGIRSGKELLAKQQTADRLHVNYLRRLWNSGIFHVMAGSFLILGFLLLLKAIFPSLPIPSLS